MSESRTVEPSGTQNGSHRCGDHPAGNRCVSVGNKVTVVLGAQWGDEGKGKVVDLLAQDADIVCRCQPAEGAVVCGLNTDNGSQISCLNPKILGDAKHLAIAVDAAFQRINTINTILCKVPRMTDWISLLYKWQYTVYIIMVLKELDQFFQWLKEFEDLKRARHPQPVAPVAVSGTATPMIALNQQYYSTDAAAQLTASTPVLTLERRRRTHAVLRSVCLSSACAAVSPPTQVLKELDQFFQWLKEFEDLKRARHPQPVAPVAVSGTATPMIALNQQYYSTDAAGLVALTGKWKEFDLLCDSKSLHHMDTSPYLIYYDTSATCFTRVFSYPPSRLALLL
ncbi:UNVERIFIED_CONTAM: hypothetical protein FKN15_039799 [Acipenser sinensis]